MNNAHALDERLNLAIDELLGSAVVPAPEMGCPTLLPQAEGGNEVEPLLSVVRELQALPRPDFKERLALELDAKAATRRPDARSLQAAADILPTLFGGGLTKPPMSRINMAASLVVHGIALSLILSSTYFVAEKRGLVPQNMVDLVSREIYPPAPDTAGGGGSGGDRSKQEASHGALPKLSDQQLTPPTVIKNEATAKLEVEPSIIVPVNIQPQKMAEIGDPTARLMVPSNGTGERGGIGNNSGTGVGKGLGPGYGPGTDGGAGGGAYRPGHGGVTAPRQIYAPDPDYSEEARKAKYQGSVMLWMIVGADGKPKNIKVQRQLGMGLDEKAIEAVKTWRFEPAQKDGQPVSVQINVEVFFRLY
jgi:periplasmic protein TonB